jgi:hypothetical protein
MYTEGFIIFIFNIITIIFLHLNTIKNHVFQQQYLGLGQAGQELYLPSLATGALYIDGHAGDVRLNREAMLRRQHRVCDLNRQV